MLILVLGFLLLLFWFQMCLLFSQLPYMVYIRQGVVPSLFVRLINAMWPTLRNPTWYTICKYVSMLLWSLASPDAHLLRKKAQGIKTMWPWMCRSWVTKWLDSAATNKRQLLGLGGMQTWNGKDSMLPWGTHTRFLSPHLSN